MADYDIAEAFQKIEEEMIASMSRNLKRHLKKERDEGMNYSMWQAEQLAALNNFRKNNEKAFKSYFSTINSQIGTILKMAHQSGAMDQETRILEAIKKGWKVSALPTTDAMQGAFFKINERKLNALIEATTKDMAKAETAMLRMADDEYRKVIFNAEAFYNTGAGTLPQCVDMATKDFLSRGISCIEYANGARVGIDSYAAMALRTAQTRAYLTGEASKRDEWGVNTVIVNKRGVACPRCLKYVGRIFYDDVWGSSPVPSPAKYPLLSEAVAGGLYHPNCKDIHTTYFEGVNTPPKPMTEAEKKEAARVYDLEQKQRYNERMIRKYKRLSAGSTDPENVKKYEAKLSEWQAHQREFVKANGDVLKRRYENEATRGIGPLDNADYRKTVERMRREIEIEKSKATGTSGATTKQLGQIKDLTNGKKSGIIPMANPTVTIGGVDVAVTERQFGFSDGYGGAMKPVDAVIYTTPEGTQFVFPKNYDKTHQTMTPEQAISAWEKVPPNIKARAQKIVEFVDYYNPADQYWQRVYKNFKHSYATGGDRITFYRYDYAHDMDYVIRTYCHEAGHYIDTNLATSANRFSGEALWSKAMSDDKIISKLKSCTKYGENSSTEDFAESIAEYVKDDAAFTSKFPNRAAILANLIQ